MTSDDPLVDMIRRAFSDKYHNFTRFTAEVGGTSANYVAEWGEGNEKRMIKVTTSPETPRGKRHIESGCDTRAALEALARIKDPEKHHLIRMCDYEQLENGRWAIASSFFENSVSLQRYDKKGMTTRKFEDLFSKVLEAERYLVVDLGMFHRDLKPSNILVRDYGNWFDVRISDLDNWCTITHPTEKYLPTAGGHFIMDPLLIGEFTGQKRKYGLGSEIYALGIDMLYALTGKYAVEYDPDGGFAVGSRGQDLLSEGRLDPKKHNHVIEELLSALPNGSRKYASIIRKCLTLDESKRYDSIDELIRDFNRAKNSGKRKRNWLFGLGIAAITGLLGTGTLFYAQEREQRAIRAFKAEAKYPVHVSWNTDDTEIQNNLVNMNLLAYVSERNPEKNFYDSRTTKNGLGISQNKFLRAEPGDKITLTAVVQEIVDTKAYYHLNGKVYFEGFEGKPLKVVPSSPNATDNGDEGTTIGSDRVEIEVPRELNNTLCNLVVELYPHEKKEWGENDSYKRIDFPKPGTVITRQTIPVVIGNPPYKIAIETANIDFSEYVSMKELDGRLIEGVTFEVSVPELGYFDKKDQKFVKMDLPKTNSGEEKTLQIIARHDNRPFFYAFLPIKGKRIGQEGDFRWYELGNPTREFSERVIDYRRQIYTNSHNQTR